VNSVVFLPWITYNYTIMYPSFRNFRVKDGYVHTIFVGDPKESLVYAIVKKLEPGWYEWSVRHRRGIFDEKNNCYCPSLIKYGYGNTREKAIRKATDYVLTGDWNG
jgi:hypothetical protein